MGEWLRERRAIRDVVEVEGELRVEHVEIIDGKEQIQKSFHCSVRVRSLIQPGEQQAWPPFAG